MCQAVEELRGNGSNIGYRQMTQRLVNDYRLVVDRETVGELLKILDPEGVELRGRSSLKRRQYRNRGPNYLWHINSYDKSKSFGFASTEPSTYLVIEFYGLTLVPLRMILLLFVSTLLTVCGNMKGQQGL